METRWEHEGKTTAFDLDPAFYCLTSYSIGHFAFGRGFGAIKSPIGPDFENYRVIGDSFKVTLLSLLPFPRWFPTKTNRRTECKPTSSGPCLYNYFCWPCKEGFIHAFAF